MGDGSHSYIGAGMLEHCRGELGQTLSLSTRWRSSGRSGPRSCQPSRRWEAGHYGLHWLGNATL